MMSFGDAIKSCFAQYVGFADRATRAEYWYFVLFTIIVSFVLGLFGKAGSVLSLIFSLATFLPSLAVSVRRLHDGGRSGWWLLLIFIPILGWLVLLFFYVQSSQEEDNEYGPYPFAQEEDAEEA